MFARSTKQNSPCQILSYGQILVILPPPILTHTMNNIFTHDIIDSAAGLTELIKQIGLLPLLDSGISGFDAESIVDDDCRYVTFPDGGWDWPLWKWKGPIIASGICAYGKFFAKKAGFVSLEWWPDLCNYRRNSSPEIEEGSVEEIILATLKERGSMITRDLRKACGFTGPKMRSLFDGYVTKLQMACRIVTEDFVYPRDKHGNEYGWGWALLTTPEQRYGHELCQCSRTPEQSYERLLKHLKNMLPKTDENQICKLLKA